MKSGDDDRGHDLLAQLEQILEDDALIDELGFVHPSQLEVLNAQSRVDLSSDDTQPAGQIASEGTSRRSIFYDDTVFWNRDHKLAISTADLPQLIIVARRLFFDSIGKYKSSVNHEEYLQNDVLRCSRSYLLLCCDSGTAWNSRKVAIARNPSSSLYMNELRLSTLILSNSPKSENSWSHRRWVIKQSEHVSGDLSDIIRQESELVKRITEKTKMNYRAWYHQCWLVSYMTRSQMLEELKISRKCAELNVADNCCFQLRRRLMIKIFESKIKCGGEGLLVHSDVCRTWEDEFEWNHLLIQRYIGREALWVHRRFLSQFWLSHLSTNPSFDLDVGDFLQRELQLLMSFLRSPKDEFDDHRTQSELAMSYFFWVLKHVPFGQHELWEKLRGVGEVKDMLRESSSPGKILLWKSFLGSQVWEELFGSS